VRDLPRDIPVKLVIYGLVQSKEGLDYRNEVMTMAAGDDRISEGKKLTREEIPLALAGLDVLAVPSQCLETGPYVVLEAQSVGTPVLGSNLGGIAELVHHGVDGWLVPALAVSAWNDIILKLATDRSLIDQLQKGARPVRTMRSVAEEMVRVYQNLIRKSQS